MKKNLLIFGLASLVSLSSWSQICVPCTINSAWGNVEAFVIDNSTNSAALTNYQVKLTVNTEAPILAGHMEANGNDIRFSTDCSDSLFYYIENYINTDSTAIWVNVPFVAAGGSDTIYMYYGNLSAPAFSNADSTFDFFDDFSAGVLDTNKWEVRGAPTYSFNNGIITFYGSNNWDYMRTVPQFTYPIVLEESHTGNGPSAGSVFGITGTDNRYTFRESNGNLMGTTEDPDVSGGNSWYDQNYPGVPMSLDPNVFYDYRISVEPAVGSLQYYEFCNLTTSNCAGPTSMTAYSGPSIYAGISSYSSSFIGYYDYFRIRKYSAVEPSISQVAADLPLTVNLGMDTSVCPGAGLVLDAGNPGSTYLWSNGATTQTLLVSVADTFSVLVNDNGFCGAASDSILVSHISVDVTTTLNDSTITSNATAAAYQWINCSNLSPIAGATNQSYTATANGSYAVIVTENGCTDTSACVSIVILGMEENPAEILQVFPNPNSGVFTLTTGETGTFSVLNSLGQTVSTFAVNAGEETLIRIPGQPAGIYYIRNMSGSKLYKLVIRP